LEKVPDPVSAFGKKKENIVRDSQCGFGSREPVQCGSGSVFRLCPLKYLAFDMKNLNSKQ
jgi:hypothetical protein